jgi:hypothetical protein
MAAAATTETAQLPPDQTPVQIGTLPVVLPELTYPNATPEEVEAVRALLAEPERDNNALKAKAVARISLAPLTPNNVGTVRKMNSVSHNPPHLMSSDLSRHTTHSADSVCTV